MLSGDGTAGRAGFSDREAGVSAVLPSERTRVH